MEAIGGFIIGKMLGSKDKTVTKQDITNAINNSVENVNKQVVRMLNSSMTSITTNVINDQKANMDTRSGAGSNTRVDSIIIKNGGSVDINQQASLISMANAILNITQDTTLLNQITTDIINDVASNIKQNTQLSDDLKAVNAIEKSKEVDGEVNNLINTVGDAVKGLIDTGRDKIDSTTINNKINNEIRNSTYFETDINNVLKNVFNTTVSSNLINNCLSNSSSFNNLDLKTINVEGSGSTLHITQESLLNNFYGCYITSLVKTGVYQELSQSLYNQSKQTVDTGNTVDAKMDTQNTIKNIEKTTSLITALLQALIIGIIAIVIVIVIVFPGLKFLKDPINDILKKIKKQPVDAKDAVTALKYFIQ